MTDTLTDDPQTPTPPSGPRRPHWALRRLWWPVRNLWRSLTSMRTALMLLFLLALAAIPGALLPQRDLNEQKTAQYIDDHGAVGTLMDRLQMFDVFGSTWFTAIYVLLFVSLVGCLTPRMIEHFHSLRAKPVAAPRNLARLPRHVSETVEGSPDEVAERINGRLRGWRRQVVVHPASDKYPDGVVEVSAEKGYLREFGNLVFHFALLALLVAIAVGKLYGYEGTRTLVADGRQGLCNNSTAVYDSFRAGSLVDGTDLSPFCIRIDNFSATFLPSGQPDMYDATVRYVEGPRAGDPRDWKITSVKVNEPLRIAGDRVYVLGNGFAPTFTVTFPNGKTRTQTVPFIPEETATMLSSGAARFDTPAGLYPDEDVRRKNQIALQGLFAPDGRFHGSLLTSASATPDNPFVAIDIYRGDTGLDTGKPQNAYSLDRQLIEQNRLRQVARVNLTVGQTHDLGDGVTVRFDGYQRWVSVQVSHDPAQTWVLVSAITMLGGLLVSLLVRRRRIWARLVPVASSAAAGAAGTDADKRRTVVEVAGLARTDQAGWGEGFDEQVAALLAVDGSDDTGKRPRRGRL
ncbi:cytochrome c biogenesis protein ResB [Gordonia sp. ABSL1-1]|uniref:cytochrome c biogenesis protein ResB n=1 Tax=Gordonia sp. ABSL1-1 TaxID=3053923 RepID=UPI0025745A73|nr:cytochrome c biogenesis protein ResB [Gordonia sp. ABSL1-1]MDL9936087.1 cytochrome c biogenesis protein ResB [Gordonia sp. ABSL1-1]